MTFSAAFAIYIKFFFILTPFFILAVFLALTEKVEPRMQRMLAARVTLGIVLITVILFLFGAEIFAWFGSDLYGRDIWTRTWEGARVSLIIAVAAAVIDMVIGMSYGLISGYFGGKVDMVMQRFLEVANGIPRLVIVTLLLLVLIHSILMQTVS